MSLCKYKDIFGSPGTGVHSYRFMNIAVIDVLFTLIFAYIISQMTRRKFVYVAIGLFILGIILHRVFCVRTTVDKMLFLFEK
jgi:NhaP-type Na+/H+ or K+/H+ antiporter